VCGLDKDRRDHGAKHKDKKEPFHYRISCRGLRISGLFDDPWERSGFCERDILMPASGCL
jgi:hypothetical protein